MRPCSCRWWIVDRNRHCLLTRRTDKLRKHSGQIAFPGGAIDPEDGTAENAALREANEEIGLISGSCGDHRTYLPRYLTGSGFSITPCSGGG
jgi:8-oxo-dGTP pyrophosphatase MutT (NUDIX family)